MCQEDGFKIETRPQYPNRVEGTEQLKATNSAINVVAKSMGPGYTEVIQGASQMEGSSKSPVNTSTHNKGNVKTGLLVCQSGKSDQDNGPKMVVPDSWEDIPDQVPLDLGPNFSAPREDAICVDGSKGAKKASFVPTDNAETTPGSNGALEPTNTDGPSIVNHENSNNVVYMLLALSPNLIKAWHTATVVVTKLPSRKEDKGPP